MLEPKYQNALVAVYALMAKEYGNDPAVMGVSIGSEINSEEYINQPQWWNKLSEISESVDKTYKEIGAKKITTTTMVDDGLTTVRAGELAKFKIDTWGLDVYRGRTMGQVFSQIASATQKPEIMAEYGASAATTRLRRLATTPTTASAMAIRPAPTSLRSTDSRGRGRGNSSRSCPVAEIRAWTSSPPTCGETPPRSSITARARAASPAAASTSSGTTSGGNRAGRSSTSAGSTATSSSRTPRSPAVTTIRRGSA